MRRGAGVWGVMLVGALALDIARAAPADPPTPLQVKKGLGAEGCPDATKLADDTNTAMKRTTLAARAPDLPLAPGVSIVVEFAHPNPGFTASIRVLGGDRAGERALSDSGAKCDDLGQAVAITLAIMLDEGLPPPAPPPSASVAPVASIIPLPSSSTSADTLLPPREPATSASGVELAVSASAGAMLGVVRDAAPYFALEVDALIARRVRLGIGGLGVLPQRFEEPNGGFAEISLIAGELFACLVPLSTPVALSTCAMGTVGGIRGRTEGLAANGESTRTWFAGGALVRLDGALLGPLGWTARGSAFGQRREAFDVQGAGPVYQPGVIGFSLGIGLSAKIL